MRNKFVEELIGGANYKPKYAAGKTTKVGGWILVAAGVMETFAGGTTTTLDVIDHMNAAHDVLGLVEGVGTILLGMYASGHGAEYVDSIVEKSQNG
jgi:hypothetical protein